MLSFASVHTYIRKQHTYSVQCSLVILLLYDNIKDCERVWNAVEMWLNYLLPIFSKLRIH